MEVRLLPHQAIGVAWMLDQEKNTPHKGGVLAYVISSVSVMHDVDILTRKGRHGPWSVLVSYIGLINLTIYVDIIGKTVQMIATMVMNLPTDQDKYKTTLIVVPAALLLQVALQC